MVKSSEIIKCGTQNTSRIKLLTLAILCTLVFPSGCFLQMRFTSVIYFLQDWSAEAKEDSRFRAPAPRVHRSVGPGHRPGGGWSAAPQQRAVPWVPSLVLQGDTHEATAAVDRSGLCRHRVFGGRGHRVRPFYSGRQSCWGWTYVRSCGMLTCIYIFSYNWTRYHNSVRYGY